MKKIKQYWKEILIGVLILFGMNKCTQSCNRNQTINKQKTEINKKDSIIKVQNDSLNILKIRWADAQASQSTYQNIALDTKQDLINDKNVLEVENTTLKQKVNSLTQENNKLKQRIKNISK